MRAVFASCSRDKRWAIWDYRIRKPITTISSTHDVPYTTLHWNDSEENGGNLFVGDESGSVYSFDIRNHLVHVDMFSAFDSPVHKFSFNGNMLAVLGQTNVVKVFDTSDGNKEAYSNSDAKCNVRDIHWTDDADSFYTIAWESGLQKHQLTAKTK